MVAVLFIVAIAAIVIGFALMIIGYSLGADLTFILGPWFAFGGLVLLVIAIAVAAIVPRIA